MFRQFKIRLQYKLWARSYDRNVGGLTKEYNAPKILAVSVNAHTNTNNPIIIDACTGTGLLSEEFKKLHPNSAIHGLDISNSMLKKCANKNITASLTRCDLEKVKWPITDNYADIVVSSGAMEHIRNSKHFIKEACRVLKSDGIIGFTYLKKWPEDQDRSISTTSDEFEKMVSQHCKILEHFIRPVKICVNVLDDKEIKRNTPKNYEYGYLVAQKF